MKLFKLSLDSTPQGSIELPSQFHEPVRPDIILRAVLALQRNRRQRYGAHPEAGKRASAKLSRRRRDYKGSYGLGISRVPRKILSHRGTRFSWAGAFAPGMVKGRRAHPPKAGKQWEQKVNKKENRKAIRSAMAATVNPDIVRQRGHRIPTSYPFVVDGAAEKLTRTKEVTALLVKLGFAAELKRSAVKKIRAGRGKSRGRPYKRKKGILVVVGGDCALRRAVRNIPGCDVLAVNEINAEALAPGAMAGRATLWTEPAIRRIAQEGLFA